MAGVVHFNVLFLLRCGSFILVSARRDDGDTSSSLRSSTVDSDAAFTAFTTAESRLSAGKANTTEVPTAAFTTGYSRSPANSPTPTTTTRPTEPVAERSGETADKAVSRKKPEDEGPLELERRTTRSVKVAKKPSTSQKKPKLVAKKKPQKVVKKTKPLVKPSVSRAVATETVPQCPPLGLESLKVKDTQLRASSYKRRGLGPHRGRLNIQSGIHDGDIYDGAWCAQFRDKQQWLEVDALRLTRFTGVILQGRASIWSWDLVHTYKVQFSNDTLLWKPCMNGTQEAMTQANLTQMSRRIIRVVSELVFQLLVPALMVRLQARDFLEPETSQACLLRIQREDESLRSSPEPPTSILEDVMQKVNQGLSAIAALTSLRDTSVSEDPAPGQEADVVPLKSLSIDPATEEEASSMAEEEPPKSILEGMMEKVNQGLSAIAALTTLRDPSESQDSKSLSFEVVPSNELAGFLEPVTEGVMSAIVKGLDFCQEKSKTIADFSAKTTARNVIQQLALKMNLSKRVERQTDDVEVSECSYCWYLDEKFKRSKSKIEVQVVQEMEVTETDPEARSSLQSVPMTYPMTVSSLDVTKELSSKRFRITSLKQLKEYLILTSQKIRGKIISPEPEITTVDGAASEMLDAVLDSVNELCQPEKHTEMSVVSEEQVASTAAQLKIKLMNKLQSFFHFHKGTSENVEDGEVEQSSGAMSTFMSRRTDRRADEDVAFAVQTLLGETLRQDGTTGTAVAGLEDLISQDKLSTFSKLLADKLTVMFEQQVLSVNGSLDPSRQAWSDSELSQTMVYPVGFVTPNEQVYLFVEEAVKRLLSSLIFPPPTWGLGTAMDGQAAAVGNWEEAVAKYEAAVGNYSQLMADQVMGNISRAKEVSGTKRKRILDFFQELRNKIRWK